MSSDRINDVSEILRNLFYESEQVNFTQHLTITVLLSIYQAHY